MIHSRPTPQDTQVAAPQEGAVQLEHNPVEGVHELAQLVDDDG